MDRIEPTARHDGDLNVGPSGSANPNPNPNPKPQRPAPRPTITRRLDSRTTISGPRQPSIQILRLPSTTSTASTRTAARTPPINQNRAHDGEPTDYLAQSGRRRSSSEPQRMHGLDTHQADLGQRRHARPHAQSVGAPVELNALEPPPPTRPRAGSGRLRRMSARSALGMKRSATTGGGLDAAPRRPPPVPLAPRQQYDSEIVNLLDVIDPEVSTLSTLTNVQNSLFIPDLGRWINRQPTYTLTRHPSDIPEVESPRDDEDLAREEGAETPKEPPQAERTRSLSTIASTISEGRYAILPEGVTLEGWTKANKAELDDLVRHMLHSRRAKIKRGLKGFGQYVRRPLGFFVTLYATLITLFGLAWVLFLIGWVNVGGRQLYVINVIDNVLVALFAVMGDGLAPFRAVDTYHMIFIAHYHHLTWRKRKEWELPKLQDKNDLPAERKTNTMNPDVDLENMAATAAETGTAEEAEFTVLTPRQQLRLQHHQRKFAKAHTFYKPHEVLTHHAFPLRLLVAIVVLLDCHSLFQIALGTCTWSISYKVRPFALTTVILCCSIACNITAGVLISVGDHRTRKREVIEKLFRQELTSQAIAKLEKRYRKESDSNEASDSNNELVPRINEPS
ncbi:hypothetical protein L228DRAFT_235003 [Xylona heveae TC161]|uniref:Integral membrane protein n=1 Tax=Xylona heveae (strain CBS 132557 / TC161) TaxID=1328760 RepID=A0A165J823_XYLHT|nr:hypothetical protein L228DRAFT_235003 [Xylona heveae TC161]KZF25873.1 hypothetical protein L228DRAFT_235003 [Xylona heveae TC161]